jgi:C2 domain
LQLPRRGSRQICRFHDFEDSHPLLVPPFAHKKNPTESTAYPTSHHHNNNNIHTHTTMGKITVYLDKIINLVDTDLIGKADPYVVLQLEQDNVVFDKNYGKKTSKKIKGNNNPVYNETFVWDNVKYTGCRSIIGLLYPLLKFIIIDHNV